MVACVKREKENRSNNGNMKERNGGKERAAHTNKSMPATNGSRHIMYSPYPLRGKYR